MWQGKYIQIVYQNAFWEGSIWYYCIDGCGEKFGNHFGENIEKKYSDTSANEDSSFRNHIR